MKQLQKILLLICLFPVGVSALHIDRVDDEITVNFSTADTSRGSNYYTIQRSVDYLREACLEAVNNLTIIFSNVNLSSRQKNSSTRLKNAVRDGLNGNQNNLEVSLTINQEQETIVSQGAIIAALENNEDEEEPSESESESDSEEEYSDYDDINETNNIQWQNKYWGLYSDIHTRDAHLRISVSKPHPSNEDVTERQKNKWIYNVRKEGRNSHDFPLVYEGVEQGDFYRSKAQAIAAAERYVQNGWYR